MGGKPQQGENDKWPQEMLDFIETWKEQNKENPEVVFFDGFEWPEINPIQYTVRLNPFDSECGSWLKIQNYRYPAACGHQSDQFKGVILFVHGFGDYGARSAHVGKMFSELGYDFCVMDSRGHGSSEGKTVLVPSVDTCVDDLRGYHKRVIQEFYTPAQGFEKPPDIFLAGHSFGTMQIFNMLLNFEHVIEVGDIRAPIKAVCLSCVFLEFGAKAAINVMLKAYRLKHIFSSAYDNHHIFEQKQVVEQQAQNALHYVWDKNNSYQRRWMPLQTMLSWEAEIHKMRAIRSVPKNSAQNQLKQLENMPILMLLGSEDSTVNNTDTVAFFEQIKTDNKKLQIVEGMGHGVFSHGKFKNDAKDIYHEWLQNLDKGNISKM